MAATSGASERAAPSGVSYESHFGFRRPPFSLAPDPRFLFDSLSHAAACDELASAPPRHEALVVFTGAIGTGKTTFCRALAAKRGSSTLVAVLLNPPATREDLLEGILRQFGVIPDRVGMRQAAHPELMAVLERFLTSLVALNAQASVVMDEAQQLRREVLEQLRVLADLTFNGQHLVQVVLIGQPELEDMLDRAEMSALGQRVTRRHQLGLLNASEVYRYIALRIGVAASTDGDHPAETSTVEPFTSSSIRRVARLSRGVPRVVNVLCDRALESAFTRGSPTVRASDVTAAARTLKLPIPFGPSVGARRGLFAAAAVLIAAAAGVAHIKPSRMVREVPATLAGQSATASPSPGGRTTADAATSSPLSPVADARPEALPEADATVVVVSAFRTPARATEIAYDLQQRALPAFARPTASGWQQVVLGPYASREEAATARDDLTAAGFADSRLVPSVNADLPSAISGVSGASGESKRVVSLSVPGRTSILIEGVGDTSVGRSTPTIRDGRLVVDIGPVKSGGWTRTFVARDDLPFVQEIVLAEVSRGGAEARLQVTVTVKSGAIGSLRHAGRRVYLDFVPRPGENNF